MGKLVLECKPNETFVLYDELSGLTTCIKVTFRENGNLAVTFEAPKEVNIRREKKQRSVKNDQSAR